MKYFVKKEVVPVGLPPGLMCKYTIRDSENIQGEWLYLERPAGVISDFRSMPIGRAVELVPPDKDPTKTFCPCLSFMEKEDADAFCAALNYGHDLVLVRKQQCQ